MHGTGTLYVLCLHVCREVPWAQGGVTAACVCVAVSCFVSTCVQTKHGLHSCMHGSTCRLLLNCCVRVIMSISGNRVSWHTSSVTLVPGDAPLPLRVVSGTHLDLEASFAPPASGSGRVGFILRSWRPGGVGAAVVSFDWSTRQLVVDFDQTLPHAYDPHPEDVPMNKRVGGTLDNMEPGEACVCRGGGEQQRSLIPETNIAGLRATFRVFVIGYHKQLALPCRNLHAWILVCCKLLSAAS